MDYIGDVAVTPHNEGVVLRLPVALGRAIINAGYTRAKVYLTEEGVLLKLSSEARSPKLVKLPEWNDE